MYTFAVTPSLFILLLANAFPVAGVLFLGWTVFPLVLLYWLENVVVGGFNVAKLLLAQPRQPVYWLGKAFLVPLFLGHFGGVTLIPWGPVGALVRPQGAPPVDLPSPGPAAASADSISSG